MRTLSGPILLPLSSGTLPGHISTTVGGTAPISGRVTPINRTRETVVANRITIGKLGWYAVGKGAPRFGAWSRDKIPVRAVAPSALKERETIKRWGYP